MTPYRATIPQPGTTLPPLSRTTPSTPGGRSEITRRPSLADIPPSQFLRWSALSVRSEGVWR